MFRLESLVLGTHNRKKLRELAEILGHLSFTLQSVADFAESLQVEESGTTFEENATLKATVQAQHLQHWVLAEDSGLLVDALAGEPGVRSARFAGPDATDEANNRLLLQRLASVASPQRTARYVCHLVLADPTGTVRARCSGECRGRIREQPAGSAGFGYDPLFEIQEYHRTFAELGDGVKSVISHRARALRRIVPELHRLATRSGRM